MKLVRWYNISLYLPRSGATALHLNCRYTSYTVRLFIKHSSYCANCLRDEIRKRGRNLRKITCTYRRNAEALFLRARECWTVGAKKSGMRKWCFCQIRFDCYFGRSLGLHNDQGSDIYIYIYIYIYICTCKSDPYVLFTHDWRTRFSAQKGVCVRFDERRPVGSVVALCYQSVAIAVMWDASLSSQYFLGNFDKNFYGILLQTIVFYLTLANAIVFSCIKLFKRAKKRCCPTSAFLCIKIVHLF